MAGLSICAVNEGLARECGLGSEPCRLCGAGTNTVSFGLMEGCELEEAESAVDAAS